MSDLKLERLKDLPTPPPREGARKAALAAALDAFDQPTSENAAAKKSSEAPKASRPAARLTSASQPGMRRKVMSITRYHYGLAASVAALVVAAPIGLHVMKQSLSGMLGNVSTNLNVGGGYAGGPARREATAPQPPPQQMPVAQAPLAAPPKPQPPATIAEAPVAPPAPSRSAMETARPRLADDAPREQHAKKKLAGVPAEARPVEAKRLPDGRASALFYPRRDEAPPMPPQVEEHRDQFQGAPDNPVKQTAQEPVSTFSLDVDTASYSFMRRALNAGLLPPKDSVRVEELINYFPYDYPRPESADAPFLPTVSVFPAPWNGDHKLVHIGIKGYEIHAAERPHANLVLLIDVSGSMSPQDRLPLLKNSFRMLVDELKPDDTISIVTYASDTRIALEPTKVADKGRILAVIDSLQAGGGTYGQGGIQQAYQLAEANFDARGVNRIVLATDGDFNIGISNRDELKGFIERKREKGIFLSVIGVGRGNYNDAMMQALAQNGNGTAAYVDTLNEARKVLVDEASSTLFPIAKDVKIQVEFNPALVSEYRLVGYETRMLKREDFSNDKVDAGDVGSGHAVTAIYEITPAGAAPSVDALRYGQPAAAERRIGGEAPAQQAPSAGEYGFLKLRYKLPKEDTSRLVSLPITPALEKRTIVDASAEARFSTAVAGFGQLLRGSPYLKSFGYDDVIALAGSAKGDDAFGYRAEFINLVRLAKSARP